MYFIEMVAYLKFKLLYIQKEKVSNQCLKPFYNHYFSVISNYSFIILKVAEAPKSFLSSIK